MCIGSRGVVSLLLKPRRAQVWDLRYSNNVPPPPPPFFPSDAPGASTRKVGLETGRGRTRDEKTLARAAGGSSSGLAGENVTQTIDVMGRRVVNSVTIAPWPRDAGGLPGLGALTSLPLVGGPLAALAGASVRLDLDHSFTVEGDGSNGGARTAAGTNRIGIVFERPLRRTAHQSCKTSQRDASCPLLGPERIARRRR